MKNENFNILLVVVLYNERLYNCNTYRTLISKEPTTPLFIYDNSPNAQHNCNEFGANVHYVSDPHNSGLSFAYNRAAEYANRQGLGWLLVLDQDTIFPEHIFRKYINAISRGESIIVAPVVKAGDLTLSPTTISICPKAVNIAPGIFNLVKHNLINSGMAINIEAMQAVGGYNERVFLDFSDYEFLRRLRGGGYCHGYLIDAVCEQIFSNKVQNADQKLARYTIFCQCVAHCERHNFTDRCYFTYHTLKRMLSLVIKAKSLRSISIFYKNYLLR